MNEQIIFTLLIRAILETARPYIALFVPISFNFVILKIKKNLLEKQGDNSSVCQTFFDCIKKDAKCIFE